MKKKTWTYYQINPKVRVKVDISDLPKIEQHTWRVTEGTTGRQRIVTSIRGPNGVRNITLGRYLMKPPKGKQVYPRRFNDEFDYRRQNLIVCTVQERQRALPKNRKATTSKYRGVSFSKQGQKWRAAIEVDGQSMKLGSFESEDEAALVYNRAAKKYFGSLAYQNPVGRKKIRRRD